MKRGYIWTALTQHIKPGVEGGGDRDPWCWTSAATALIPTMRGHAPPTWDTLEGGGGAAVYFGSMPGADSDRRQ